MSEPIQTFVPARMGKPISHVKVDILLLDVKSELGTELIPRTSTLIAYELRLLEQIDQEIIRSLCLHAEHEE